jgi:hypothetical protein
VAIGQERFAQCECGFGDSRRERGGCAKDLQRLGILVGCKQRAPELNTRQETTASTFEIGFQERASLARLSFRDKDLGASE